MHMSRKRTAAVFGAMVAVVAGLMAAPAGASGSDRGGSPIAIVVPRAAQHWDPLTDSKWELGRGQAVMTERGTAPPGPRRPFEYAVVTKGPELRSLSYSAEVRIDEPVTRNDRDVILVWNYQSPTRFYYAHLSQDNTIYPHNGIFVVDNADRRRIDDQWNGSVGAPPAVTDAEWHDVRVQYDADSGEIAAYVDGASEPLMTATDTTFSGGRVGFGSFDNYGRARHFRAVGTVS
jgi:hypothetical protein